MQTQLPKRQVIDFDDDYQSEATFRESRVKNRKIILTELSNKKKFSSKLKKLVNSELAKQKIKKEDTKDSESSNVIYWTKETIEKMREKFRKITSKVKHMKATTYEDIKHKILNNQDDEVLEILTNSNFKRFYRNNDEVFPENVFLEILVELQKFDLLKKILQDSSYSFDYNYIFVLIGKIVANNNALKNEEEEIIHNVSSRMLVTPSNEQRRKSVASLSMNKRNQSTFSTTQNNQKKCIIENLVKNQLYDRNSQEKIHVILWILAQFGMYESFRVMLRDNPYMLEADKNQFNQFNSDDDIANFGYDSFQFQNAIENCLNSGFEELAIFLCEFNSSQKESGKLPNIAAECECMTFLRYLWEKDRSDDIKSMRRQSRLYKIKLFNAEPEFKPNFSINSVIKILDNNNKKNNRNNSFNISKILSWKNIEKDKSFVEGLFQYNCFEQISVLMMKWPAEVFMKLDFFKRVIYQKERELILFYLKKRECRQILVDHSIQEFIVKEYMSQGEFMYYGAELLIYIFKNQWKIELTKDLCKNITKTIKTKDILNCHSPILSSLLLIEFLKQIKQVSVLNASRCEKLIFDLKEYCKNIQDSNSQENYISYLMKQKDTKGRTAFQITAENQIYSLLETPEIGTIVKKMWDGTLSFNGFSAASSLHRFLFDKKTKDPFRHFDQLDVNKFYFFQLSVWLNSCSMRFNPIGLSSICLVIVFNLFIYMLNLKSELMNNYSQLSSTPKFLLFVYIVYTNMLVFNFVNQIIFLILSKRPFKLEVWDFIDILLFIFSWLCTLDTKEVAGEYKISNLHKDILNYLWTSELAFTKELSTENSSYTTSLSFILRVLILSINDFLVWGRVMGVLLTYRQMGPVMRMIFSMAYLLIKYIIIIAMFLACCAGIFTSLFNRFSNQFIDFSTSVVTLFGGFLNTFDCNDFESGYIGFGSALLMAYVCISAVLLVNLLIAVLSNVFENLSKVVDASHRAILIQYYKKNKWDKNYGYLLFLTTPFNIINAPMLIFNLIFCCKQKTFNKYLTRLYYLIFYFPFIIIPFIVYTAVILIFCYLKGIVIMFIYQYQLKTPAIFKILNFFNWFICGIFFLVYIFLRDIFLSFIYVFNEPKEKGDDYTRVRKNITNQDVIIFLKFIHSDIPQEKRKDIHTLFMAYLEFEATEKMTEEESVLSHTKSSMKTKEEKRRSLTSKTLQYEKNQLLFYHKGDENKNEKPEISTASIRKNLMIIEILENFLIDDENGTYIDIEKMRKLLPVAINIKSYHLRRLIHSDIHILYEAITKLKTSKTSFIQYQLMNRIMSLAQRMDKQIDLEVSKVKRFRNFKTIEKNFSKKEEEKTTFEKGLVKKDKTNKNSLMFEGDAEKKLSSLKYFEKFINDIFENVNDIINSQKQEEEETEEQQSYFESIISSKVDSLSYYAPEK